MKYILYWKFRDDHCYIDWRYWAATSKTEADSILYEWKGLNYKDLMIKVTILKK